MQPLPARSSVPTPSISVAPSPSSSPPNRATISSSLYMQPRSTAALERLQHLFGDVDTRTGVYRFLQDDVVLVGLRDLLDGRVGTIEHGREFLVAALVQILAEFTLLALELAVEVVERAFLFTSLGLTHGQCVALEVFLHGLQLACHALEFLIAGLEFLLETLLGNHGRSGFTHQTIGINEADLRLGARRNREQATQGDEENGKSLGFHINLRNGCDDQNTEPNWNWNRSSSSVDCFLSGKPRLNLSGPSGDDQENATPLL